MEKKLIHGELFKRVLSLALAFVMLFGLAPVIPHAHAAEVETVVYLKPNANWQADSARFAIYYYNDYGNAWTGMSDADGDGYYEGTVPAGYTNIIFCRMNPATTENNWDNKWNQTADLTLPTDGTNCYTVAEGAWDKGDGSWSVYPSEGEEPKEPETPEVTETTYVIAGSAGLCGTEWEPGNTDNAMTLNADGIYEKTYANVAAGSYSFKVTDGTWSNSWGKDGGEGNFVINVTAVCDVTITFNAETKEITAAGDSVVIPTELVVDTMTVVGNGNGNWLNGANWNVAAASNAMTEVSDNVYEITYTNISAGAYQFKFAANGSWSDNWGGVFTESGVAADAAYNSSDNISFDVEYDAADVTIQLDLTGFDYTTKSGAKFTVTITEVEAEPTVDYYLFGYINGANYACEEDYANMGEYKFVNGKVKATFTADSYVAVKTTDNAKWYMTDGWQGEVTSATLYDSATLGESANKLMVPANIEVVFTLVENADGTLTLSYAPAIPEGYTAVTIHFLKPDAWTGVNAYLWATSGGAVAGYEDYNAWPGAAISENAEHAGWYDVVIATEEPQSFNFIFNDGTNQTGDLTTGDITGDTELWVVGDEVLSEAPKEWSSRIYNVTIYFHNTAEWETVNAKFGQGDTWSAIAGYEDHMSEYGAAVEEDTHNSGWHTVTIEVADDNTAINGLFNNGSWGDGNQTGNWTTGTLTGKQEFWYDNGVLSTTAPAGWVDPNRIVSVPGTLGGNNWNPAKDVMTYDADLGLYVYTFENVPPANYEFKIAINGSWAENYGASGVRDGSNIAVAVPETMDVTVYYNDETHLAVTNVTYKFLDIDLSGTGIPEGTKMTDKGLSGIYKATVTLAPGAYEDIKMSIVGGAENTFNAFELEEEKDVTFFYDPASGFYYHNAIPSEIDETKVKYDSQDIAFKAPFGAVATGEEITFSIETGVEVQQVSLVITGKENKTVELTTDAAVLAEADGTTVITWTGKVTLDTMGEYDYYFVLSDGSTPVVYCDDDGYYGEGMVTDLSNVKPYDLVVHKAGFETPDWMKNAVVYQIFPDRFFDGDESNNKAQTWARGTVDYEYITDWYTLPENPEQLGIAGYPENAHSGDGEWSNEIYGGDLKGITERIDYLKALGVNVIYLNPVFWSISNHRYDAVDYTEIDPILGTLGDFEELVAVAEANGMHIILDGVFNHVSDDSVYFDRYYKFLPDAAEKFDGKIGAYPYWAYVYDYMAENDAAQADAEAAAKAYFSEEYGITDYSYTEWFAVSSETMTTADTIGLRAGKPVYSYEGWWGYDSMPVIYSTNGSEYQTGNWAEEIINDPNGTDSVTEYWITKGNNGWRLDVANEVSDETWQKFRASVKALDSDAVIIGEIWDDATKYLMGDMYDSVMNYQFRNAVTNFAKGTSAEDTTKVMEKIRERYPEEAFYAMMNLVGSHDTTRILSYLDGIPDDRTGATMATAFPTYEGTSQLAKDRQYLVAFLQFTYAGAPTIYYGDEIGMVGADDPDDRRAFEWGKGNQELVEWYATLAAIRDAYPALRTGSVDPIDVENTNVMGYVRADDNNTLTVLANNSTSAQSVVLDGTYVDLISGETFTGTVPAMNGVILVSEEDAKEITVNTAGLAPAYDASYTVAERPEEPHAHVFDQKVVEDEYLVSAADCDDAAVYHYSCACGKTGTETFTYGEALGHDWDGMKCSRCEADRKNPFTDITAGTYYYDPVLWAAENNITNGYGSSDIFAPDVDCPRAQLLTLLWRAAGEPEPASDENPFVDVRSSDYYYTAVLWASEQGILAGYGRSNLCNPDGICTRGQVATILHRYFDEPAASSSTNPFTDVEEGAYYYDAVLWAVEEEITNGYGSSDIFNPDGNCTRAQVVTFLYRALA